MYLPLLTWYWISFLFLYFSILSYSLSPFLYVYRIRSLFSKKMIMTLQYQMLFTLNIRRLYKSYMKSSYKILCSRH